MHIHKNNLFQLKYFKPKFEAIDKDAFLADLGVSSMASDTLDGIYHFVGDNNST